MDSINTKLLQIQIYYFYMLADGECTAAEGKNFFSICNAMNISDDDLRRTINFCEVRIQDISKDNSAKVIQEITWLLSDHERSICGTIVSINRNKETQATVIWNLINLGYADNEYSEAEKKVVSFLSDYWAIDEAMLADMIDTAETIFLLTQQKKWLESTSKPYVEIKKSIENIDKNIKQMFANIELLIADAEIA